MMLVPTLEKFVAEHYAKDFWLNHMKAQDALNRQNEDPRLDEPCLRIAKIDLSVLK